VSGSVSIGRAARSLGVSPRTLRYYEERGLIPPAERSPGGNRRYGDEAIARVERIRELQSVMGFDLDAITEILTAEDDLARLRAEWQSGQSPAREEEILREATEINRRLQGQVRERMRLLADFLGELESKARRYRKLARDRERRTA
jgi:DNA-binding transcriptional MerR regulator